MGNTRPKIGIGSKFLKSEKGATLVWVALLMPILIGFCALVIDIGHVILEKHRLQNAMDAACLAGASKLPDIYGYNGGKGAISIACDYLTLNGYNADETKFIIQDPSDSITPTFTDGTFIIKFTNGRYTINITCSKTVENIFGKAVGFNDITVHPRAAATRERNVFDYAIFSGSSTGKFVVKNDWTVIGGMVHTNSDIQFSGSDFSKILDGCDYTGNIIGSGQISAPQVSYVEMPNLLDLITVAKVVKFDTSGNIIKESTGITKAYVQGLANVPTINGSWTYDGTSIDGGIYVDGNLIINSGDVRGKGAIIVKGTIIYNGSGPYFETDSALCLCSLSTDPNAIKINGGTQGKIYGIIYAPYGGIKFGGTAATTVEGRIIGNNIALNGAQLIVNASNMSELNLVPRDPYFKLTQ